MIIVLIIFLLLIFFKKEVIFSFIKNNNYSLLSNKEMTLNEVWVTGLNNELKENIIIAIHHDIGDSINSINLNKIKERIDKLYWVKHSKVIIYPHGIMEILIDEYIPFAIFIDSENYFLVNKNGYKFLKIKENQYSNLFKISGEESLQSISDLKNLIYFIDSISLDLDEAVRIDSRRWDLFFNDDIHIKLPAVNSLPVLKKFINFDYNSLEFNNIRFIDLRIPNRIIIKNK